MNLSDLIVKVAERIKHDGDLNLCLPKGNVITDVQISNTGQLYVYARYPLKESPSYVLIEEPHLVRNK